jgi:hypothetical protein
MTGAALALGGGPDAAAEASAAEASAHRVLRGSSFEHAAASKLAAKATESADARRRALRLERFIIARQDG